MNILFGFSYSGDFENLRSLVEIVNKAGFEYFELEMDLIDKYQRVKELGIKVGSINNFICSLNIDALVNDRGLIRRQFLIEVEKRVEMIPSDFDGVINLGLVVDEAYNNPQLYSEMLGILKKIFAIFLRRNLRVSLPLKLPLETEPQFYSKLIKDVMMPNFLFSLDIYPHRLKDKSLIGEIMNQRRYDTGMVRVRYALCNGEIISEKLFSEIKNSLQVYPSSPVCYFDPLSNDYPILCKEILRMGNLLKNHS